MIDDDYIDLFFYKYDMRCYVISSEEAAVW